MATLRTLCVSIYEEGVSLTPEEQQFSKAISQVRVLVAWLLGEIVSYFTFLNFKKNLKNRLKSCWLNVFCLWALQKRLQLSLSIKYLEVFGIDPPQIRNYFN